MGTVISSRQSPGRTTILVLIPTARSIAFCSDFSGSVSLVPGSLSSALAPCGFTYKVCLTDLSSTSACPMADPMVTKKNSNNRKRITPQQY